MSARLMQFLAGLSRRERLLLALLVFLALPLAAVQGIALPLLARQEAARAAVAEAEALRGWVRERQAELAQLPAARTDTTSNPSPSPAGLGTLEASLIDAGLRQSLVTLMNPSGTSVSMRFDAVHFSRLMPWLEGLEREMGYRMASLRLSRTNMPDLVDAEIQLEQLP